MIIFEIILGLVVAIGFYNLIHHFFVIIPNRKRQLFVQHRIDWIIKRVLWIMKQDQLLSVSKVKIHSDLLSHVWGRNIFAYDYTLNLRFDSHQQLLQFKRRFQRILVKYCFKHRLLIHQRSLLILADLWNYDNQTHLDIAYRINSSTLDYLRDLKKCKRFD